ncbi:hypothetical protein MACH26_36150 [Planctobacterium marinum]|uniref:Uncharacterized protein n=1 Tax=Planctobacterium marinum TaxID=1631968 RepID=A0AA48HMS1_9ALTE|nr:hypothetical protein MACH26_36150 [Planctobacterium marinum]
MQFNHYNPDRYAQETSPDFILFLSGFPETFHHILDEKVNLAEDYSTKQLGALRFEDVFGNLLLTSTRLPSSKLKFNIILKYLISFFQDKFYSNNWLANLKLNAIEASILLNCNTQQVAALADQGILPIHNKRLINPLNIYTPAFELGDVFCVWMTKFQSEHSNLQVLTSKW